MSIRSLFRKDKVSSVSNPSMPQLPSQREMIEDIENIKKNDPILSLAAILDKKGSHSAVVDTDIKELMGALQKRKRRESASSTSKGSPSSTLLPIFNLSLLSQKGILNSASNSKSKGKQTISEVKESKPKTSNKGTGLKESASSASINSSQGGDVDYMLDYDKLKHFLTTCEHSQELISNLEPEFKTLNQEISEYSKARGESEKLSLDSEPNLM